MSTIDERQRATADSLVQKLAEVPPGREAVLNLIGVVGSGKTNVLRRIAEHLRSRKVPFLFVSAPADEVDCAAIALLEMTGQLQALGLADGQLEAVHRPTYRWSEKSAAVTKVIDDHAHDVVILCDEPSRWFHRHHLALDESPDYAARSLAEWIIRGATCRRLVSGRIPDDVSPRHRIRAPRLADGRELLKDGAHWGSLEPCASGLLGALREPVPLRSVWEMRLGVALCLLRPVDEVLPVVLSEISADAMLQQLLDLVERDPAYSDLCTALTRLAIARTAVKRQVIRGLIGSLPSSQQSLIEECLLDREGDRGMLHPLVRHEVIARARDPHRWETNRRWHLSRHDRQEVHRGLVAEYPLQHGAVERNSLESLHHELLSGTADLVDSDTRVKFVEQLHEVGRALSYTHHDHAGINTPYVLLGPLPPDTIDARCDAVGEF